MNIICPTTAQHGGMYLVTRWWI